MTTPLTKLIEENKERLIAEAPKDGRNIIGIRYFQKKRYFDVVKCFQGRFISNVGQPTHFRPLPDDRLARVTEVLLKHINGAIDDLKDDGGYDARQILEEGIRRATAIAEGKE